MLFRACARNACITPVQLYFMVCVIIGQKVTPSNLMLSWNAIHNSVAGTVQPPRAMAFDLEGLSCAPVAFSNHCIALRTAANSAGWITNTVTSSAYVRIVRHLVLRPTRGPCRLQASVLGGGGGIKRREPCSAGNLVTPHIGSVWGPRECRLFVLKQ